MIKRFFYIFSATLFIMLSSSTGISAEVLEKRMETLERNLNSPPGFNYQAVLRNSDGTVMASQNVTLRFTISNSGGNLWKETHAVSTDAFGAVTAVIGSGTKTGGSASTFDAIDWGAADASIKVEVDTGSGFVNLGTTALQSVPYAAYAENGLSAADQTKLDGIEDGAQVNVQADWNVTDNASDAFIANKPTIPSTIDDLADGSGNAALNGVFTANELAIAGAFNLPTADGTNGQVLTTDGAGNASWADAAGGSYAGTGANTFVAGYVNAGVNQNQATSDLSTVGGGSGNSIGSYAQNSVISGGDKNSIVGSPSYGSDYSTIAGGQSNTIGDTNYGSYHASIGGGSMNSITYYSHYSVIAGGNNNSIYDANNATIGGGKGHYISGGYSGIFSGSSHYISRDKSFIGGGEYNKIYSRYGIIGGGTRNSLYFGADYSSIVGGKFSQIGYSKFNTIGGGGFHNIYQQGSLSSGFNTIAGGSNHSLNYNDFSTIGGGRQSAIQNSNYSTIGGGASHDIVQSNNATVSGGKNGQIQAYSHYSTISGGKDHTILAEYATIPGGYGLTVGSFNAVALGAFNSAGSTGTSNAWVATEPLLVVGNGTDALTTSDAMVMLKNGNTDINGTFVANSLGVDGAFTLPTTDGTAGQVLQTNGSGVVTWANTGGAYAGTGTDSFVAGASDNFATAQWSTAVGGSGNSASALGTTIAGGLANTANQQSATILGGFGNTAGAQYATILGGKNNQTTSFGVTVMGLNNSTTGGTPTSFVATDALLVVGNGVNSTSRSDALVLLKDGNMTIAGSLTQNSDRRLKRDIMDLGSTLNEVSKMRGVKYKWNDLTPRNTESVQIGLIAQEVEELFPELVKEGENGYKSVDYINLIPVLIEAIKELNEQNKSLMAENSQLEKANDDLEVRQTNDEARFAELESKIDRLMMLIAPVDMAQND